MQVSLSSLQFPFSTSVARAKEQQSPTRDTLAPVDTSARPRRDVSAQRALSPSPRAQRCIAASVVKSLAVACLLSAQVGADPIGNTQQPLGGITPKTPGEDMFKAYLGDWRCVIETQGGMGEGWTKFTTPPSWYRNAVEVWWRDLYAEESEGTLLYVNPIDQDHAEGSGPWLKRRYDNNILPTWGDTNITAERQGENGWRWVSETSLRDSSAHWFETSIDKFDPTGVVFQRNRTVHHVDSANWWKNDTMVCTLLENGPRALNASDVEFESALATEVRRTGA